MKINPGERIPSMALFFLVLSIGLFHYTIHFTFGGLKVFLPELILLLLLLIGLFYVLVLGARIEKKYLLLSALLFAMMSISSAFSISPVVSLKETLRWAEIIVAFLFTLNFIKEEREMKVVLVAMIAMGLLHVLWGIKKMSDPGIAPGFVSRLFDNPNQLALYLDLNFSLVVAFLFAEKRAVWRIWWGYALAFVSLGLYLARSQGSWISNGLVLTMLFTLLLYCKTRKEWLIFFLRKTVGFCFWGLIAIFFIFLFIASLGPGLTEALLKKAESGRGEIFACRLYYNAVGYRIIEDFPLTGTGGNLYKKIAPYYIPSYAPPSFLDALKKFKIHNLYLVFASEYGLPAFFFLLLLLHHIGKDILSFLRSPESGKYWLVAGASGSAAVWLLHNLVDDGFSLMAIQWGILLGVAVSRKEGESEQERR